MMAQYNNPGPCDGAITLYCGLTSDELSPTTGNTDDNAAFANNFLSTSNIVSSLFDYPYSIIYKANACIEGLEQTTTLSTTEKNQLIGEAKIVRAFLYFNLINLYGSVPLVVNTNYAANASMPRTSADSIYNQIIADLQDAEQLMSPRYPTSGRVRPNQYTATSLLAKVYLYEKNWKGADSAASAVINSGLYNLEPNLNNVFLIGSNEAIWQLTSVQPGYETAEGYFFVPTDTTVIPSYLITNSLLQSFEVGDQRSTSWLNSNLINGQKYYYPYKYKLGNDGNTSPIEGYMIFRIAEQYLIRAEAKVEENDLPNALVDLNTIRIRANLPGIPESINQTGLLTAIQHERQIELFCELGSRWFDLKRTETINTILGKEKTGWQPYQSLYPIPITDIQSNPFLTQNQGYF